MHQYRLPVDDRSPEQRLDFDLLFKVRRCVNERVPAARGQNVRRLFMVRKSALDWTQRLIHKASLRLTPSSRKFFESFLEHGYEVP